jgi:hypothetical protein
MQDVDFLAALDDNPHGEDTAEDRLKILGTWFEAKEDVIQRLTSESRERRQGSANVFMYVCICI